jgi:hypothetical protein
LINQRGEVTQQGIFETLVETRGFARRSEMQTPQAESLADVQEVD